MANIVVYRGQKEWDDSMHVVAPSSRNSFVRSPEALTEAMVDLFDGLLHSARTDAAAKSDLEHRLLDVQQNRSLSPFVSCSFLKSVAIGFATHGDTAGYVLEIHGDDADGWDIQTIREDLGIFSNSMKYLNEFAIPRSVSPAFRIERVDRHDTMGSAQEVFSASAAIG
jgi:hypothetical protein